MGVPGAHAWVFFAGGIFYLNNGQVPGAYHEECLERTTISPLLRHLRRFGVGYEEVVPIQAKRLRLQPRESSHQEHHVLCSQSSPDSDSDSSSSVQTWTREATALQPQLIFDDL